MIEFNSSSKPTIGVEIELQLVAKNLLNCSSFSDIFIKFF